MSKIKKEVQIKDHPDVEYLKQDHIGDVIALGLSVLAEQQPKNGVDFLAKWLLNYAKSEERAKEVIYFMIFSSYRKHKTKSAKQSLGKNINSR
jgi:hypothetical protein